MRTKVRRCLRPLILSICIRPTIGATSFCSSDIVLDTILCDRVGFSIFVVDSSAEEKMNGDEEAPSHVS